MNFFSSMPRIPMQRSGNMLLQPSVGGQRKIMRGCSLGRNESIWKGLEDMEGMQDMEDMEDIENMEDMHD